MANEIYLYLRQGGLIMVPLILCSCIMWTLILDRAIFFFRLEKKDIELHQMFRILEQDQRPDKHPGIRAYLINQIMSRRTHDRVADKRIIDECAMPLFSRLERFLATIAVLAAVSPLFGLLGTVTGMITTFDVITLFGTGNARAMAGGISEALVTTQSGLLVSIPGLFMSVFLYRQSSRARTRLEEAVMILKRSLK
ncbi:ExbB: biopolymer transport protein [Desulfobacula toluolica Tol2]|uniref:ExbB: biopolymer transport protein n=2 Tax=Desulfobacula TaxID=28222 RepID=K0NN57_DESTT|nr:ExbB: biopolymer transport protein [Desulfobacula toluolica Tol2]